MLTVVLELGICAGVLWCLRSHQPRVLQSAPGSMASVGTTMIAVSSVTVFGMLAGFTHEHSHGHTRQGSHAHQGGGAERPHHDTASPKASTEHSPTPDAGQPSNGGHSNSDGDH